MISFFVYLNVFFVGRLLIKKRRKNRIWRRPDELEHQKKKRAIKKKDTYYCMCRMRKLKTVTKNCTLCKAIFKARGGPGHKSELILDQSTFRYGFNAANQVALKLTGFRLFIGKIGVKMG